MHRSNENGNGVNGLNESTRELLVNTRYDQLKVSSGFIGNEGSLSQFLQRLQANDAKRCDDPTRLFPACKVCIPGLRESASGSDCNSFETSSKSIRDEIAKLTMERFGPNLIESRKFGLYPYLETQEFLIRHQIFGKQLLEWQPDHILDIGAYYNPIYLFMNVSLTSYCPKSVIIIEPILEAASVMIPCIHDHSKVTHIVILPVTFKFYAQENIKSLFPNPNAVVCIGCDSHYGPNRHLLETSFKKPYRLYLEYPSEYVHNAAFRKMMGSDTNEELIFHHKFQAKTNATQFTKRVMKVIEYS